MPHLSIFLKDLARKLQLRSKGTPFYASYAQALAFARRELEAGTLLLTNDPRAFEYTFNRFQQSRLVTN